MERASRPTTPTSIAATRSDPTDVARAARSIVSCPADVELVVDGTAIACGDDQILGLADPHGAPTFSCHVDAALADAAEFERSALVTVRSGLGRPDDPERATSVVLAGRLRVLGTDHCDCCGETRTLVGLDVTLVVLTHRGPLGEEQQCRVEVDHYRSGSHQLNRGVLQRSVEHANDHHQDELRRAVSTSTGTRLGDVLGVRLTGLSTRGVEVAWVDPVGAHRTVLDFPSPARTPAELGELLRRSLHAGLC